MTRPLSPQPRPALELRKDYFAHGKESRPRDAAPASMGARMPMASAARTSVSNLHILAQHARMCHPMWLQEACVAHK